MGKSSEGDEVTDQEKIIWYIEELRKANETINHLRTRVAKLEDGYEKIHARAQKAEAEK